MTRTQENVDASLAIVVFTTLKPTDGNPTYGSARNGTGGFTVFSLDAVIPGQPASIPQSDRDAGRDQMVNQYGLGEFTAFVQALRADAEVIVNDDVLAAQDSFQ